MNFVLLLSFFIAGAISFYIFNAIVLKSKRRKAERENDESPALIDRVNKAEISSDSTETEYAISPPNQQLQKTLDDQYRAAECYCIKTRIAAVQKRTYQKQ